MKTQIAKDNPYGKTGDLTTKQIIDRILNQHFDCSPGKAKSIGEIEDEMMAQVQQKVRIVDFAKGENCDFPGSQRI